MLSNITVKYLNVAQYQTSRIHDTFTNVFSGLVKVKSLWNNFIHCLSISAKDNEGIE